MSSEITNRSEQEKSVFGIKLFLRIGERAEMRSWTTDETWLHYDDPEKKQQSSVRKNVESRPP